MAGQKGAGRMIRYPRMFSEIRSFQRRGPMSTVFCLRISPLPQPNGDWGSKVMPVVERGLSQTLAEPVWRWSRQQELYTPPTSGASSRAPLFSGLFLGFWRLG